MSPEYEDSFYGELDDWKQIINSEAWTCFIDLINKHAKDLAEKALVSIRQDDEHNAKKYAFRLEECKAILTNVNERVKFLTNEVNEKIKGG